MSDDGAFALVVILLLGNPFSPAYARARARRGVHATRPLDFCSLHVALHGPRQAVWSLTERSIPDGARTAGAVAIGRSRVAIERDALVLDIDERAVRLPSIPSRPALPRVVKGRLTLHPEIAASAPAALDAAGEHTWWPVAPLARVDVELESPRVRFRGHGYHDANAGSVPIDATFAGWTWSRARSGGRVVVAYDVVERGGEERAHGMVFGPRESEALTHAWRARLPATAWRLDRSVAADEGHAAKLARSLTDSPFYARSLVQTRLLGRDALAVHEVLSAERLRRAWVRFLLGFRMARGA